MSEWLQNIKAGDTVILDDRRVWGLRRRVRTVERTTATQVIVDGVRYRRDNGRVIGGSTWDCKYLREPTPDALTAAVRADKRDADLAVVERVKWSDVADDVLASVADTIRASKAP